MMLERRLFEVLDSGRTHINENPTFIDQFFCGLGLTPAEAASIRTYWLNQDKFWRVGLDNEAYEQVVGVNIAHQFPRQGDQPQFPGWFIVLMDDKEVDDRGRYLGDELDDVSFNGQLTSLTGSIKQKTFGIFTYATNPDVCIYYYELCRFFLHRNRDYLKGPDIGVLDTAFSGGDMAPDPRYAPENMFVRRFTIETKVLEGFQKADQEERAFKVGGAWVRNPDGLDVTTIGDGETISPNVTPIGDDE